MSRPITSLTGFVKKIAELIKDNEGTRLLFRGHSKRSYVLQPSVFRTENHTKSEHTMLRQLLSEHPMEFTSDLTTFDKLVRAQHYGLPTRLIDITKNPLVALYFSCSSSPSENGRVVVIKPRIQEQVYYDSSIVSVIANLSLLKFVEKEALVKQFIQVAFDNATKIEKSALLNESKNPGKILVEILNRSGSSLISDFNKSAEVEKLCSLIRREIPDFSARIDPRDLYKVVSVVPRKLHARIVAQDGGFLLSGLSRQLTEHNMLDLEVEHFDIDCKAKPKIQQELSIVGVSEQTLFPEIQSSANQIRKRYS